MRKLIIFLLMIISISFINININASKSYQYVELSDRHFIKESENVYKNENDYIYFNTTGGTTLITMSFSKVTVEVVSGKDPLVVFPDGCTFSVAFDKSGSHAYGTGNVLHNHDHTNFARLSIKKTYTPPPKQLHPFQSFPFLVVFFIGILFTSYFVFKPSNIRKWIKYWNHLFPMYKEPYEPTAMNIVLNYLGQLVTLILCLAGFIFSAIGLFF